MAENLNFRKETKMMQKTGLEKLKVCFADMPDPRVVGRTKVDPIVKTNFQLI